MPLVQCQECGRKYEHTPENDYYTRDSDGKKVCMACLIAPIPISTMVTMRYPYWLTCLVCPPDISRVFTALKGSVEHFKSTGHNKWKPSTDSEVKEVMND